MKTRSLAFRTPSQRHARFREIAHTLLGDGSDSETKRKDAVGAIVEALEQVFEAGAQVAAQASAETGAQTSVQTGAEPGAEPSAETSEARAATTVAATETAPLTLEQHQQLLRWEALPQGPRGVLKSICRTTLGNKPGRPPHGVALLNDSQDRWRYRHITSNAYDASTSYVCSFDHDLVRPLVEAGLLVSLQHPEHSLLTLSVKAITLWQGLLEACQGPPS